VGQIGSEVRVSVSFQKKSPPGFVLREQKVRLRPRLTGHLLLRKIVNIV